MNNIFRRVSGIALVFAPALALSAAQHPAQTVVESTVAEMLQRLDGERQALEQDSERLYTLIDDLITPNFDFETISKLVLREHWKQASASQREEFSSQFRLFLIRTYARALFNNTDVKIDYLPLEKTRREDLVVVRASMMLGKKLLEVGYRMKEGDGQWKVVDIVIDGISLVQTYRGSFGKKVEKNGMDSLLSELREKNAAPPEDAGETE